MYNGQTLLPYQFEGRDFLVAPNSGNPAKNHKYLAWHPGTGKSCIVSAALVDCGVHTLLLVCPVRIKRTWAKHLVNWGVVGSADDIYIVETMNDKIPAKRVIIVSFELLLSQVVRKQLEQRLYDAVVVDEAHKARTITSQRSNILFGKNALVGNGRLKWLLSGTPFPNGTAAEAYTAIASLYPECIGRVDYETFLLRYCGAFTTFNGYGTELHLGTDNNIDVLKEQFKDFFSFKTLEEVAKDLPPIIEKQIYINIGQLGANEHDTPLPTLARLIGEAKAPQVREYIWDWLAQNDGRLLTFAYHRSVIQELTAADYSLPIYGGMSANTRDMFIHLWKTDQRYRNLVLQINAAGEAIDGLQHYANHILIAEPDWTPGVGNQAIGRLYRIGQTKPVYVTTIVADNTLDETKIYKYNKKQGIIDRYFENENVDTYNNTRDNMTSAFTLTEQQVDRVIDLFERLVDLVENNGGEEKPKQTRQRKAKNGDAQTLPVQTPPAPSAPDAAVGAVAVIQPMPTDLPTSFTQVIEAAKAAKARITAQYKAAHGTDDATAEAKAIEILSASVIKKNGFNALPEAETADPQKWLLLMQGLASKQYVPTQANNNQLAGVGF